MPKYGWHHQQHRTQWAPLVATGTVTCARHNLDPLCPGPIRPGDDWDLDHADDGIHYRGPAHAECNRRHGAHLTNTRRRHVPNSRPL